MHPISSGQLAELIVQIIPLGVAPYCLSSEKWIIYILFKIPVDFGVSKPMKP